MARSLRYADDIFEATGKSLGQILKGGARVATPAAKNSFKNFLKKLFSKNTASKVGGAATNIVKSGGVGALVAGTVLGVSLLTASITGKCGGNIGGFISIGDCAGNYAMNVSTEVYTEIVKSFEQRITQNTINTSVISSNQSVIIRGAPISCGIYISQTTQVGITTKMVSSNTDNITIATDIINKLAEAVQQQVKEVTGFLSAGTPGSDISQNIYNKLTSLITDTNFINYINNANNSFINLTTQGIEIDFAKPDPALLDFYLKGDGCQINITQDTLISMQFDSVFNNTLDYINNTGVLNDLLLQVQQQIDKESKGVESLVEAMAEFFNKFIQFIVIALIAVGIFMFMFKGGGKDDQDVETLLKNIPSKNGESKPTLISKYKKGLGI